jgi:hypothetical protein
MGNIKECPFNRDQCNKECALFIDPQDLNETVKNKLASLGVLDRNNGICSFKNIALCMNRYIFENTSTGFSR